jgi:hypothetical protein
VPGGDELEERFAGFWFEGDTADLIEVATHVVNWVLKSAGEVNERRGPADGPTPPLRSFAASRSPSTARHRYAPSRGCGDAVAEWVARFPNCAGQRKTV